MYAIFETGGKQYRVSPGDVLEVELLAGDRAESVQFDRVLMVGGEGAPRLGQPTVRGAVVHASVLGRIRAPKVLVFKKKLRKGYKRLNGHRQDFHRVRIDSIAG